jgi:hypothetical protein
MHRTGHRPGAPTQKNTNIHRRTPKGQGVGGGAALSSKSKFKKTQFLLDTMISDVLLDLPFSRNQPLKSAEDQYLGILKNKIKSLGSIR